MGRCPDAGPPGYFRTRDRIGRERGSPCAALIPISYRTSPVISQLTGSFHMGVGVGVATFDLAASAAGTVLRFSFRAIGVVDAEVAGAMSRAWAELAGTRLKGLVETRTRLGINPDEPPTIRSVT
jgi:hypothetical protein